MEIEFTEIHLKDGFSNQLKISGTTIHEHAKNAATEWADENNCLLTEISFNEEGQYFIAVVCSDDYQ
jgi:hypothetical protein